MSNVLGKSRIKFGYRLSHAHVLKADAEIVLLLSKDDDISYLINLISEVTEGRMVVNEVLKH